MSTTLLNTLYVFTEGSYLRLDNETVRIEREGAPDVRVPLHHLGAIVILSEGAVSSGLLAAVAERGIAMTWLDPNGRFRARLEGPVSGNILLRRAQHSAYDNPARRLELARAIVAGKLRNSRAVLQRGAREAKTDADRQALERGVLDLDASLRALPAADSLDSLRGSEGAAAKAYFGVFSHLIRTDLRADFGFTSRSRRPPRDRINALLSFAYTLITHDCRSACEAVGLDSQLGFLHELRPGRPALALDLVEEFRANLADRLVLTLLNRGQIKASEFDSGIGGGITMNTSVKRTLAQHWQERKKESLHHPLLEQDTPIALLPLLQARLLARAIRGESDGYLPFLVR
jgi:CRISPR-associated protein Cas1